MHLNGESDMRAVYIVTIITLLMNLDKTLLENVPEFISKCQTYEGGIGSDENIEAHGGYTFCGYAALIAMKKQNMID